MIDSEVFASRLRQLRSSQGVSQYRLAEALSISRSSVKNWELGYGIPSVEVLVGIATYLHVTTDYLLGLDRRTSIQVDFLSDNAVGAISNLIRIMQDEKSLSDPTTSEEENK